MMIGNIVNAKSDLAKADHHRIYDMTPPPQKTYEEYKPKEMFDRMVGPEACLIFIDSEEITFCIYWNKHFYDVKSIKHHDECPCCKVKK